MAVKKHKTVDKWKKKSWYTIVAPKMFEEKEVGTTPADDPRRLIDRVIETPLREITGNIHHQFVKLLFRITDVKGTRAHTLFDGFELVREYLRRNIRRRRSMVRAIETLLTRDGKRVQITVYAFTAHKTDTAKKKAIRAIMVENLRKWAAENTLDDFVRKCLFGELAGAIQKAAKTVVPIRRVEIAKAEMLRA